MFRRPGELILPDEAILRDKARAAIHAGRLPSRRPDRTWGGAGSGEICIVCGESIERHELELEMEFRQHDDTSIVQSCHAHLRCFAAWELERTKIDGASI
jgi:hypothetical protein